MKEKTENQHTFTQNFVNVSKKINHIVCTFEWESQFDDNDEKIHREIESDHMKTKRWIMK